MSVNPTTLHLPGKGAADSANPYAIFNHVELPLGSDGTPLEYYRRLRDRAATEPVGRSEQLGGFWVVAGYDEIREVARRPDAFSNRAVIWPNYNTGNDEALMMAAQDEPQHRMYRALVQADFSPKTVQDYDAPVRRMTTELIDGFIKNGRCEVSDVIADEVPARLTAYFLGFDEADSATYRRWSNAVAHGLDSAEATNRLLGEMYAYFAERVEGVKRAPGDDVLSRLTQVEVDGRALSNDELIAFCLVLLLGGIHNSAKVMASAFWRLGQDTPLRQRLASEPALIGSAVEEFLRFYTPAPVGRSVIADGTKIGGVTMNKDDVLMLALPVGNRDAGHFERPDEFIVDRHPNRHLALGHGIHACLGGSLIRVEMKAVLEEFLHRIPEFALAQSTKTPRWQPGQTSGMTDVVIKFPV